MKILDIDFKVSEDQNVLKESTSRPVLSTVLEEGDLDAKTELFPAKDFQGGNTLERMPEAPTEVPPLLVPEKNPKMYQLVQMSGESSFWWDSTDSDEGTFEAGLSQSFSPFQSPFLNDAVGYDNINDDGNFEKRAINMGFLSFFFIKA